MLPFVQQSAYSDGLFDRKVLDYLYRYGIAEKRGLYIVVLA
jgi:hypothetical protein